VSQLYVIKNRGNKKNVTTIFGVLNLYQCIKTPKMLDFQGFVAERVGFEPTWRCRQTDFEFYRLVAV
jgi:hypothetical protein